MSALHRYEQRSTYSSKRDILAPFHACSKTHVDTQEHNGMETLIPLLTMQARQGAYDLLNVQRSFIFEVHDHRLRYWSCGEAALVLLRLAGVEDPALEHPKLIRQHGYAY